MTDIRGINEAIYNINHTDLNSSSACKEMLKDEKYVGILREAWILMRDENDAGLDRLGFKQAITNRVKAMSKAELYDPSLVEVYLNNEKSRLDGLVDDGVEFDTDTTRSVHEEVEKQFARG